MSATTTTEQGSFLQDRLRDLDAIERELESVTRGLAREQLARRPADGGWSIAEVLEHLVTADGDYLPMMRERIATARADGARETGRPWSPSFAGGMLARALDPSNTKKSKAPGRWRPPADTRPGVLDAYRRSLAELREVMRSAQGLDLSRVRLHSPVSRLIRLNLGDAFLIITTHARRHLGQMRRVRAEVERG